jgi:hypothetical protein
VTESIYQISALLDKEVRKIEKIEHVYDKSSLHHISNEKGTHVSHVFRD